MRANDVAPNAMPVVLSIAGSDSSAGAGIQADLKTLSALGVYGATVITAITAQNSLGVSSVYTIPAAVVDAQLDAVLTDMPVRVIKTGMLASLDIMRRLVEKLPELPLVLDPVMISSSGFRLQPETCLVFLRKNLLPKATLLTPNLSEAAMLLGTAEATSLEQVQAQARALLAFGPAAVLLKGGHFVNDGPSKKFCIDVLATSTDVKLYKTPRIVTGNTHGSGCTLASAIAAGLAKGHPLAAAVKNAKHYITHAISGADLMRVGRGCGPVDHFHPFNRSNCEDNL